MSCPLCLVLSKYFCDSYQCSCCFAFLLMYCVFLCDLVLTFRLCVLQACEYVMYCFTVFLLSLQLDLVWGMW
jgi:hypothetical protein